MKKLLFLFLGFLIFVSTSAARAKTAHISVTWPAATPESGSPWKGCGSGLETCYYVVSRAVLKNSGSGCPATNDSKYAPLNESSPTTALEIEDTVGFGSSECYLVQTVQKTAAGVPVYSSTSATVRIVNVR